MKGKICMVGCFQSGLDIAGYLHGKGIKLSHVVTLTPAQARKRNISGYADFTEFCRTQKIKLYHVDRYDMKSKKDEDFFAREKFDALIIGGWTRLIPAPILKQLKAGGLGVHGSPDPLPAGRGRSPMNWALIEGRKRFIMHLFKMTPGVDDGDIVATRQFDINAFDTIRTLYFKYTIVVKRLLEEYLPKFISGDYKAAPQKGDPKSYPKRSPEDGLIDWESQDVEELHNFIRAQTKPYPGAFTFYEGKKVWLWDAKIFDTSIDYPDAPYGAIVEVFDRSLIVKCRGGLLIVDDYEPKVNPNPGTAFGNEKK